MSAQAVESRAPVLPSCMGPLEKLYGPLVTFGRRARAKGAEVAESSGSSVHSLPEAFSLAQGGAKISTLTWQCGKMPARRLHNGLTAARTPIPTV